MLRSEASDAAYTQRHTQSAKASAGLAISQSASNFSMPCQQFMTSVRHNARPLCGRARGGRPQQTFLPSHMMMLSSHMMMTASSMCTQAVPPAGEDDDTAELLRLGLTAEQAARVLCTLGPMTQPLSTKLDWFKSQGLTDVTLYRMLAVSPELFRLNSNHLQAQLAALRATGLSPSQVAAMVNTAPLLLTSKE
ncbi:MAG: hypothetical protein WDW38_009623 [Sanguina aurantia]